MHLIGAACVGFVWGWLGHHLHWPASRRGLSLAVILSATGGAAFYHGWQLGNHAALCFFAGALTGAIGYGGWREELQRRANSRIDASS